MFPCEAWQAVKLSYTENLMMPHFHLLQTYAVYVLLCMTYSGGQEACSQFNRTLQHTCCLVCWIQDLGVCRNIMLGIYVEHV